MNNIPPPTSKKNISDCLSIFSLKDTHQKILKFTLAIIILIGITLGALSINGYLPQLVSYISVPCAIIMLIPFILVSFANTKPTREENSFNHRPIKKSPNLKNESNQKNAAEKINYPIVTNNLKPDFFIDVLNTGGYLINNKTVSLSPLEMPVLFTRLEDKSLEENLNLLRTQYQILDEKEIKFQFLDLSTEHAINLSKAQKIALNFANENHAGGGPGFHKDPLSQKLVYDSHGARAQEESLWSRSTLGPSLLLLPHTPIVESEKPRFIRNYYRDKFDSTKMAYLTKDQLFAVQANNGFYESSYLEAPKDVTFITSAAKNYSQTFVDCSKNSEVYKDAEKRINTQLLAAASSAAIAKKNQCKLPIEIILGAFGCGAFVPLNSNEYRTMIATIYKELLPKFKGFFDIVTFAVPTFGSSDPLNAAVINYTIFKSVLEG